ncbi:kinase-like domain-containing protein [Dactylonectria macrodidyma]|uniref:Kinase-like domain-containing protein n=1 Tax=Dactylonectria macrodidyma TaxID=307937 RepID=A0A9P9EFQ6_9HYPO|nr:kinase-like domain-containing protein [Dactylonectria macrodidyma]
MSRESDDVGQEFLGNFRSTRNLSIYGNGSPNLTPELKRAQSDASATSNRSIKVHDYGMRSRSIYKLHHSSVASRDADTIVAESGGIFETHTPPQASSDMDKDLKEPYLMSSEMDTMEEMLHNATLEAKEGGGKEWLPASDLDRICEPATVFRELQMSFPDHDAKRYTDYVCGASEDTQNGGNSSRMIFAILVFITKVPNLPRFVEAELRDEHLPFLWLDDTRKGLYSPSSPYGKKALPCFRKNDVSVMKLFYQAQWQLLVPFIARDSHDEVKEYQLYGDTIMPWTAFAANAHDSGFSQVRQVEIHKSHHTFHQHKAFALKTLLQNNPNLAADEFKSELYVFMKMRPEKHLLELCATFKVKKKGFEIYSFLFPWADGGSLGELWTKQPSIMLPGKAVTPRLFLRWIAEQCHGLATALRSMHDVRQQALKKVNPEDARGEEDDEYYGIHGDLKPENILHFSQLESPTGLGILKIADFGLTEFHTLGSRTTKLHRNAPAPAPTYRAPELVVPGEYFSRKADIWALGCVFSQLMTWAVHGVKSVVDFDNLRKEERDYDETKGAHKFKLDTFFKATYFANHGVQTSVKESTQKWLDDLQRTVQSDKGENFLTDFGNLIRHDMLENDRNKRIGCESLVERLATFLTMEKGRPDDPYWNPDLPSFPQPSLNETMMPNSLKTRSNKKTPAEELNGGRTKKNQPAGFRVSFDLTGTLQED